MYTCKITVAGFLKFRSETSSSSPFELRDMGYELMHNSVANITYFVKKQGLVTHYRCDLEHGDNLMAFISHGFPVPAPAPEEEQNPVLRPLELRMMVGAPLNPELQIEFHAFVVEVNRRLRERDRQNRDRGEQ